MNRLLKWQLPRKCSYDGLYEFAVLDRYRIEGSSDISLNADISKVVRLRHMASVIHKWQLGSPALQSLPKA